MGTRSWARPRTGRRPCRPPGSCIRTSFLLDVQLPDVALVDIRMPPTQTDEGLRAAQQIRERWPSTGVLVLSQYVEPAYAIELLGENAAGVGYLLKDRVSDIDEFAAAVRRIGEGGSALDPAVVSQLVGRRRRDDPLEEVTPREREVQLRLPATAEDHRRVLAVLTYLQSSA